MADPIGANDLFSLAAKVAADFNDIERGVPPALAKLRELAAGFDDTEKKAKVATNAMADDLKKVEEEIAKMAAANKQNANVIQGEMEKAEKAMAKLMNASDQAEQSTSKLSSAFGTMQSSASGLTAGLEDTAMAFMDALGPAGAIIAVAVAGEAAIFALGAAFAALAKDSVVAGAELYDTSQRVSLSATTLSALKLEAEQSGSSLAKLSAALFIMDKNFEKAAEDPHGKLGVEFQKLKIDLTDNETGLRTALVALNNLGPGFQQAKIAADLFGRSGKDILEVLKNMGGDLDGAIAKFQEMGLVIDDAGAKSAFEARQQFVELDQQLEALKRQVGEEFLPIVLKVVSGLTAILQENRATIVSWGASIEGAVEFILKWVNALDPTINVILPGLRESLHLTQDAYNAIVPVISSVVEAHRQVIDVVGVLTGIVVRSVNEMMSPVLTLTDWMKGEFVAAFHAAEQAIKDWSKAVLDASGAAPVFEGAVSTMSSALNAFMGPIRMAINGLHELKAAFEFFRSASNDIAPVGGFGSDISGYNVNDLSGGASSKGGRSTDFDKGAKGKKGKKGQSGPDPADEELKELQAAVKMEMTVYKEFEHFYDDSLKQRLISLADYVTKSQTLNETEHEAILEGLDAESMAALSKKKGWQQADAAVEQKRLDENIRYINEGLKLQQMSWKDQEQAQKEHEDTVLKVKELSDKRAIDNLKAEVALYQTTQLDADTKIAAIELAAMDRKIKLTEERIAAESAAGEVERKLLNELALLEVERGNLISATTNKTAEDLQKQSEAYKKWAQDLLMANLDVQKSELETAKERAEAAQRINTEPQGIFGGKSNKKGTGAGSDAIDAQIEQLEFLKEKTKLIYDEMEKIRVDSVGKSDNDVYQMYNEMYLKLEALEKSHQQKMNDIQQRAQEKQIEEYKKVADQFVQVWDKSLNDLFTKGWKQFFADIEMEFLKMIQKMVDDWLKSEIVNILKQASTPPTGQSGAGGQGQSGASGGVFGQLVSAVLGMLGITTVVDASVTASTTATIAQTTASVDLSAATWELSSATWAMVDSGGGGSGGASGMGGLVDFLSGLGGMAGGGDFSGSAPFLVGERGPEIVNPGGHSGTVIPNNVVRSMGAGGGHTFNISFPISDPSQIASRQTQRQIESALRDTMMRVSQKQ